MSDWTIVGKTLKKQYKKKTYYVTWISYSYVRSCDLFNIPHLHDAGIIVSEGNHWYFDKNKIYQKRYSCLEVKEAADFMDTLSDRKVLKDFLEQVIMAHLL